MDHPTNSAIDTELGLSRRTALAPRSGAARSEVARISGEMQRQAEALLNVSAPETLVQKALDALVPSQARREKRRGEGELVRQEIDARIALHALVKDAQKREMEALASAWAANCELAAAEEIGTRGLETFTRIDAVIDRAGAEFDQTLEAAVERARGLTSPTARESAADRIERRKSGRAETERAVMEAIEGVIRASAPRR